MTLVSPAEAPVRRRAVLVWALVRLPLVAVIVYLFRHPILNLVERWFDIFHVTRFAIDVLSTPLMRFASAGVLFLALLLLVAYARRVRPALRYTVLAIGCFAILAVFLQITGTSARRGLIVGAILAANLAPSGVFRPLRRSPRAWNTLMLWGVGLVELFLFREYCTWIRGTCSRAGSSTDVHRNLAWHVPGLLLTSAAFAILASGGRLVALEQRIRMPPEVQVIERGRSFNGIELDPTGAYLYVTGHAVPHLRRYDVRNLSVPPLASSASTGGAQGFAYDRRASEIHAFNTVTRRLLSFDAATLQVRRSVDVPDLSPGDPWTVADPVTDTVTLVSEADEQIGAPLIVLDRTTGRVLERNGLDAGNVLMHPARPWLYLSFFRRRSEIVVYDLEARRVTHTALADARAERLVFWNEGNEVLVTSPMESRILRFDADDLRPKGHVPAPFGARAIALDGRRKLLLCGNLANGYLVVMELPTGRRLRSYYLGPWLRTIALDVERGTAYVSSNGALYRVSYAAPLAPAF